MRTNSENKAPIVDYIHKQNPEIISHFEETKMVKKETPSKYKCLSENELDAIADCNTEEKTKRQTKWAVVQFKSK